MKPIYFSPLLSLLIFLAPASGNAAGSMLRISCEGDDVGAEVLINGKFRGECPIDLQVPEGQLKLLVRKKVDAQRERVFEQEIRMGEGSVKRIEARLGASKLNAGEEKRRIENRIRMGKMPMDLLQKEADAGDAEAMFVLSTRYSTPEPVITWSRKAAEAGHAEAMYVLSLYYRLGKFVQKDLTQTRIWERKAIDAGWTDAMVSLAGDYSVGVNGLPENKQEAFRWYRRAAEQGNLTAMMMLGSAYRYGDGVPRNYEEAVVWWRRGADAGSQQCMINLARSYERGEGVPSSLEIAIFWWRKAAQPDPGSGYRHPQAIEELKKRGLQ